MHSCHQRKKCHSLWHIFAPPQKCRNRWLRAFVVIDLKKGKFKPEYASKLNFYCNVVNDRLKHPDDQPTILGETMRRLERPASSSKSRKPGRGKKGGAGGR